jgi:hypothetical protein
MTDTTTTTTSTDYAVLEPDGSTRPLELVTFAGSHQYALSRLGNGIAVDAELSEPGVVTPETITRANDKLASIYRDRLRGLNTPTDGVVVPIVVHRRRIVILDPYTPAAPATA